MVDNYRYKAQSSGGPLDDPTPEYMNLLGMVFSMCGLMMKVEYRWTEYSTHILWIFLVWSSACVAL